MRALTCGYTSPPYRVLQISEAVAIKAVLLDGGVEPLLGDDKTRADCE